jgi:hypothetical protein
MSNSMASPSTDTDFITVSQNIVQSFLQTVVIVDDRAYEPIERVSKLSEPPPSPVRPRFTSVPEEQSESQEETATSENVDVNSERENEVTIEQATTAEETSEDTAHELDAKGVIEQFANKGIICAVLRPSEVETEQFEKKMYALAEAADVLIFDWVWFKDVEGKKVSELIAGISKEASHQDRLRLILIYTGEKHLKIVIDDLAKVLVASGITDASRIDDFTIHSGGTRITVYGKGNVEPKDETLRARMSPFDQLPNTVVSEFTKLTSGLISNVALDAFAGLRANTYKILAKFDPDLDAAYLTHRALSEPPDETEFHLVPLILSEIQAVLEEKNISSQINLKNIERWLSFQTEEGLDLSKRMRVASADKARKAMLAIIEKGVRDKKLATAYPEMKDLLEKLREESDKKALNNFTDLLTKDGSSGQIQNELLALLMSLRSRYGAPPPILTLGTIIVEELEGGDAEYWVCVQPLCDSVRLTKAREFPFLRMNKSQKNASFGFLVRDDKEIIRLALSLRPFESRLISFTPSSGTKEIRASKSGDKWYFNSGDDDSKAYRWIADLKTEHAQRVANDYARQISRVGLTESEWLRRWAKKK